MPTSDHFNITPIVTILRNLAPSRMLDIGCGFGKYGVLAREYLDVWHGRLAPSEWQLRLEGIEAFAAYRNPIHDSIYNAIHQGEALAVLPTLGEFDLVLIADVIEHFEKDQARALVTACFERSPVVVISTPREFYAQDDVGGNPYERHRCVWGQGDFTPGISVKKVRAVSCDIFVASRRPLDPAVTALTGPADLIYLWSRKKLGPLGWPVARGLRLLCRWLG